MQFLPTNSLFEKIGDDLSQERLSIIDDFLPPALFKNLCLEARRQHMEGLTRLAKIGRLESSRQNMAIRGDKICWLNKHETPQKVHGVFDIFSDLRESLKSHLLLPLHDSEQHFAVYPVGSCYRKHIDCHKGLNNRLVTFILYLNRTNWSSKNGGQLRIWTDKNKFQDILPLGNRLVLFSSPDFYHEVLPALSQRYSFTGWFRREAAIF